MAEDRAAAQAHQVPASQAQPGASGQAAGQVAAGEPVKRFAGLRLLARPDFAALFAGNLGNAMGIELRPPRRAYLHRHLHTWRSRLRCPPPKKLPATTS